MQSDLDAIYENIKTDSVCYGLTDWVLWGILADCYEDMGWEFTPQLRKLLALNKRPYMWSITNIFMWFRVTHPKLYGTDPESDLLLPHWNIIQLPETNINNRPDVKGSYDLRETMEAACIALVGLEDIYAN